MSLRGTGAAVYRMVRLDLKAWEPASGYARIWSQAKGLRVLPRRSGTRRHGHTARISRGPMWKSSWTTSRTGQPRASRGQTYDWWKLVVETVATCLKGSAKDSCMGSFLTAWLPITVVFLPFALCSMYFFGGGSGGSSARLFEDFKFKGCCSDWPLLKTMPWEFRKNPHGEKNTNQPSDDTYIYVWIYVRSTIALCELCEQRRLIHRIFIAVVFGLLFGTNS